MHIKKLNNYYLKTRNKASCALNVNYFLRKKVPIKLFNIILWIKKNVAVLYQKP